MSTNRTARNVSDGSEHWALAETIETPTHTICVWKNVANDEKIRLPFGVKPTNETLAILEIQSANSQNGGADFTPDAAHGYLEDFENLEDDDSAATRVLTLLRSSENSGAKTSIKIYRVKDGAKDSYCGEFTPEEFEDKNLELIRSTWGGGKYRIRVYGQAPGKAFGVMLNEVIEIENSLQPVKPGEQVNGLGGAGMNTLMRLEQRLDQLQMGNGGMAGGFKETLSMMAMMKDVLGGNSGPQSSVKEMLETYQMIDALKNGKPPEPERGEDLMSLAGKVFELIQQQRADGADLAGAPAPAPIAPPPAGIPHVEIPQNFEQNGNDDMNMGENLIIKMTLRAVVKAAQANKPIEPIAVDLAEKLPDEVLDILDSVLWFEALQEYEPGVVAYEAWFTALRNRIIELTTETPAGASVTPIKTPAARKTAAKKTT